MGGIGSGNHKPGGWMHRAEELSCLYHKLGTLEAVAAKVGITRERVRQILTKGRQHGICKYSPRQALCDRLPKLPDVLKTASTFNEVGRQLGYAGDGLSFLIKKFNLPRRSIKKQIKENYLRNLRVKLALRLQQHGRRLGTPALSTTILEQDTLAKTDYTRWARRFGGIHELRKELGLEVRVEKGWGKNNVYLKAPSLLERVKKFLTLK